MAPRVPEVMVVVVTGTDPAGDPVARPVEWRGDGAPPMVLMHAEPSGRPALAPGDRVLARLKPIGRGRYEGRTLKRLSGAVGRVLGVFRAPDRLVPTDRRAKAEWVIPAGETLAAESGEIVLAEPLPGRSYGLKPARVIERLGRMGEARSVSLICIHTHDIPTEFDPAALAEAARARGVALGRRTDLRDLPLITIDGEDARDFDDAVFAEPDGSGFRLIVAIADVAHYVRPGSALDRDARLRGNSVYFPDRVVPMLPEALSNGWCSLRPGEDRGCLFAELHIDAEGRKLAHRFGRGLMRSAARLTYEQVQEAADRGESAGLPEGQLASLYAAFRALLAARLRRGTLDLDLPERRVVLDEAGRVADIVPRARLDSHRLIEEFMVLANVAAAEMLGQRKAPCMYRVHAPPSDEKLANLRQFLATLDISLPAGNAVHPRDLDAVLRRVAGTAEAPLVNEVMLRSQSQAAYSPDNIGHFGLSLPAYAHFTSPIRRYADLLVHRALIRACKLGLGGLPEDAGAGFEDTAEHISATERRAAIAERDAVDRYLSAHMADKIGARFAARISGVARFGLFVTLAGNGANGLIPLSSLPDDYWMYDEPTQTLTGKRTRASFRLAQEVLVTLAEASPVTGGLIFALGPPARRHCARREEWEEQAARVKPAILWLLLLIGLRGILPAAAAEPFDARLAADVFEAGLSFVAPRSLEPRTPAELAMWGLHGIVALDATLEIDTPDGEMRLNQAGHLLFAAPIPVADDALGWARLVAGAAAAASLNSAMLRRAGTEALIGAFFDEMFSHFDIYSRYEPPAPAQGERDRLSGQAGAGMALTGRLGALRVSDLVPDGPADAAGVHIGDRILTVNGQPLSVLRGAALRATLTGDPGTRVDLRVRGLDGVARLITLHLGLVPPQTVFPRRDGDLLVLRISAFASDTAERLSRALDAARVGPAPPGAVVIDLHGNRGGLLRQAVNAVALFADHGMIASTAGRAPEAQHDWRVEGATSRTA